MATEREMIALIDTVRKGHDEVSKVIEKTNKEAVEENKKLAKKVEKGSKESREEIINSQNIMKDIIGNIETALGPVITEGEFRDTLNPFIRELADVIEKGNLDTLKTNKNIAGLHVRVYRTAQQLVTGIIGVAVNQLRTFVSKFTDHVKEVLGPLWEVVEVLKDGLMSIFGFFKGTFTVLKDTLFGPRIPRADRERNKILKQMVRILGAQAKGKTNKVDKERNKLMKQLIKNQKRDIDRNKILRRILKIQKKGFWMGILAFLGRTLGIAVKILGPLAGAAIAAKLLGELGTFDPSRGIGKWLFENITVPFGDFLSDTLKWWKDSWTEVFGKIKNFFVSTFDSIKKFFTETLPNILKSIPIIGEFFRKEGEGREEERPGVISRSLEMMKRFFRFGESPEERLGPVPPEGAARGIESIEDQRRREEARKREQQAKVEAREKMEDRRMQKEGFDKMSKAQGVVVNSITNAQTTGAARGEGRGIPSAVEDPIALFAATNFLSN